MAEKTFECGFLSDLFYPFSLKEFKDTTSKHGIFGTLMRYFLYLIFVLGSLPVLPFCAFNQWSKSWFNSKTEDIEDGQ